MAAGTRFGAYEVTGLLGRGGMATVYLAQDHKHHRRVAVKVLHAEVAAAVRRERFLREIDTAAGLHHPHILPLHDSGDVDGLLYYVCRTSKASPCASGCPARAGSRSRRAAHRPRGGRSAGLRPSAGRRASRHQAGKHPAAGRPGHRRRLRHRPSHRCSGADRSTDGSGTGTPAYMSPEQASPGADVDGRTDIYALGASCTRCWRRAALHRRLAHEILARHATDPVPPLLATMRSGVPPSVEAAITKALAKAPADRFATAHDMGNALTIEDVTAPPSPHRRSR